MLVTTTLFTNQNNNNKKKNEGIPFTYDDIYFHMCILYITTPFLRKYIYLGYDDPR